MGSEEHEWELSKENVQPLRGGREMASLAMGLHSDHGAEHEIKAKQNEFELELRTYSGFDPFDVWDRYIKWTEQYFPKGGHDGHLMALIERCLKEFQSNDVYKSDPRFIQVWIRFACSSEDPVEVFTHMFDNGIGLNVAAFYCEWATSLERRGDNKNADVIYNEGLKNAAQPRSILLQRHQQFQNRVARNITLQIAEGQNPGMDMGDQEEQRLVLGRLKAAKKSHKVGTERTGAVSQGPAGCLKTSKQSAQKQIPEGRIQIYDDENAPPSVHLQQTHEWKSIPTRAVDNRENERKPGVWTKAKIKQRPVAPPGSAPFVIHEDPDSELPQETPRKTTLINNQPLSSRKPSKYTDALNNLKMGQGVPNLNEGIPMYQKDKVYNGMSEFSFEELRAARYWKLQRQKAEEAEKEQKRLKDEAMQRRVQEMAERMASMEALLQHNLGLMNQNKPENVTGPGSQLPLNEEDRELSLASDRLPDQVDQEMTEDGRSQSMAGSTHDMVTPTNNASSLFQTGKLPSSGGSQNASLNSSQRTPIFNSLSTYSATSSGGSNSSTSNFSFSKAHRANMSASSGLPRSNHAASSLSRVPPVFPQDSSMSMQRKTNPLEMSKDFISSVPNSSFSSNSFAEQGRLNSTVTPKSSGPTPESTSSLTKKGYVPPSPTVMTKEAMAVVQQMFSTSFDNSAVVTDELGSFHSNASQANNPPGGGMPFQICEDRTTQLIQQASVSSRAGGVEVFCDEPGGKENSVMGSTRKVIADQENDIPAAMTSTGRKGGGLQIHCDEPMEGEDLVRPLSEKKGVRRGLGFLPAAGSSEDVEMTGFDRELHTLANDFTIECQARDDMTLAALDSFSVHAHAASTPFAAAGTKLKQRTEQITEGNGSAVSTSSAMTSSTFGEGIPTPSKQNLSPILEGSGEGGSEDSKSSASHQSQTSSSVSGNVTLRSRHGSARSVCQQTIAEDEPLEEQEDRDASMPGGECLSTSLHHHQIDTSAYIHLPDDKERELLSTSVMIDPQNPFDDECIAKFLGSLDPPLSDYPNFFRFNEQVPLIPDTGMCYLAGKAVDMEGLLGQGGYAKIYKVCDFALDLDMTEDFFPTSYALKYQSPPCFWEFYVSCELHQRLSQLHAPVNIRPAVVQVERGYFYQNASLLEMQYLGNGSLLSLVNRYSQDRHMKASVEPFACLLTIELLHLFEQIHSCQFIHGDVKPDNFLIMDIRDVSENGSREAVFGSELGLVRLIDFGQSIDLTKFPEGTTFTASVATSGFQCIEMRTDRPWTFQTDLFGLAGTIHVVLFGSYMNVFQEQGQWKTTGSFNRKWNVPLWKEFFSAMLNIPSCDQMPNLASLRQKFEEYFMTQRAAYNMWLNSIRNETLLNGPASKVSGL
ncbi:mitotic checkpoint serine/threonine-protein kinase BUB1 isoform X2 [Aplysia californica]|uniref:Mitotic checkpoint serine/threonine-protein kinase BUB1 isoform X2 n=1 Tax=Aplysia californica TaxID=6500 RepID=A0ABM0JKH4_APLCA|nr:mitotic checkpoint serine/threonine-protein kinase BUB1 isoform X2 [Aplysia californica]